jgi:hypothetical protein
MRIRLEFKPQDCWVGMFLEKTPSIDPEWALMPGEVLEYYHHVWVCLLPMLPIHASWTTVA